MTRICKDMADAGQGERATLDNLKAYLSQHPAGAIKNPEELASLLAECWEELQGCNDGGMEPYKLRGRMENVEWNSRLLEFDIERHGATVLGSVYAELQHWVVNLDSGTVSYGPGGRRVVGQKQKRLDVQPIAKEIAQLVVEGKEDVRLKWKDSDTVRVCIGEIIPDIGVIRQNCVCRHVVTLRRAHSGDGGHPVAGSQ